MANALLDGDFGGGFGGYAGGGAGRAWASIFAGDKRQRLGVSGHRRRCATRSAPNVDAGVKYRYFHTGKLDFNDAFTVNAVPFTTTAKGNYDSHSVLASLVYNFNARGERQRRSRPLLRLRRHRRRPRPRRPRPAPDGSVILATSACPAPPPPPPPPPVERGERGR